MARSSQRRSVEVAARMPVSIERMPRRRAMTIHRATAPTPARQATKANDERPWSWAARDRMPSVPNRNAAATTIRTAGSRGRESGMPDMLGGRVGSAGRRFGRRLGVLAPCAADPDVGERHAQLAERLDGDEEPSEEEHHGDELRPRERARYAEAVERVAGRGDEPTE